MLIYESIAQLTEKVNSLFTKEMEKIEVQFVIDGNPVPKSRPKFTKSGHTYTPKKTKDYERLVGQSAWVSMAKNKIQMSKSPVHLEMIAYMPIPKSWSRRKKFQALAGALRPNRPDIDNLLKAVLDGCNKIIYNDDSQVYSIWAKKVYETWDIKPCVVVNFSWT